jgi:hypothetical protein
MKTFGSICIGKYLHVGFCLHRFGFGLSLDRYSFNLDFAFFWFSIEW